MKHYFLLALTSLSFATSHVQCNHIHSFGSVEQEMTTAITGHQQPFHSFLPPTPIKTETIGNYTLSIGANNNVAHLQMPSAEYNAWDFNSSDVHDASKALYTFFEDDFDFIFFVSNNASKPASINYYGQLLRVNSAVQGISKFSSSDQTATYGSAGKLQSVIHLPYRSAIKSGPTLHELAHNWANFMKDFEMASPGGNYPALPHWGWTSIGGQLGGFKKSTLQDLGSGNYQATNGLQGSNNFGGNANGGNGLAYSNWELYLMGFLPKSSLEDIIYFENVVTDATLYGQGKFSGTQNTYSVSQFISDRGERSPSSLTSQKNFKILTVIISDAPLQNAEWTEVDGQIEWLAQTSDDGTGLFNFWEATQGLGSLTVDNLEQSLKSYNPISSSNQISSSTALSSQQVSSSIAPSSSTPVSSSSQLSSSSVAISSSISPSSSQSISSVQLSSSLAASSVTLSSSLAISSQAASSMQLSSSSQSIITVNCDGIPHYNVAIASGGAYQWGINFGESVIYNHHKWTANSWADIKTTTPDQIPLQDEGLCLQATSSSSQSSSSISSSIQISSSNISSSSSPVSSAILTSSSSQLNSSSIGTSSSIFSSSSQTVSSIQLSSSGLANSSTLSSSRISQSSSSEATTSINQTKLQILGVRNNEISFHLSNTGTYQIQVIDLKGQQVQYEQEGQKGYNTTQLPPLKNGMYYILLKQNSKHQIHRVIITE